MKKNRIKIVALLMVLTMSLLASCSGDSDKLKITHKDYTEQRILGQMLSVYLEDKGFETEVVELGGTMLCFNALKSGEVDLYVEYTGTGYGAILEQEEILPAEDTYNYTKENYEEKFELTWLEELGFNNTYVLSITEEMAEKYNIKTVSDLIPYSGEFSVGCDKEFASRYDGLPGLMLAYPGLEFKSVKSMDQGLTYQAVANGDIDVNVSYSTDGRISKFGLVNLEDDLGFFPPYYAVPNLSVELATSKPELTKALNALKGQWTEEDMQIYNLMGEEGTDIREVATIMLKDRGLID